ncbi:putative P-loop containing nucleoside triphosphate hydrolase, leucine-rich repeat domain superfamily [Helianthus debilis subsp. tardiflorus]
MMYSRKVLLVLDDVDDIGQLEALAGEPTWFKRGSRIIITTRDEQVLKAHQVNFIHDVSMLSHEEAICLFSRYAFGREIPSEGYTELSRMVVHYAVGLPLTIKVLGSFLYGRIKGEWKDTIKRLKTIPLKETLEKLELSYSGVENDQKEIFLDIACLLKGETKKKAIRILESCGFHAQIGLRVLEQKSLITISKDNHGCHYHYFEDNYHDGYHDDVDTINRLHLHDHIEEMGMNIARRLHPVEPKRHSRLWIREEIEDILINESVLNILKFLNLCGSELRSLDLRVTQHLEVLNLGGCSDFVELQLPVECPDLKFLSLNGSKVSNLNLGMTPCLEHLNLGGCVDFVELQLPVECPNLKILILSGYKEGNLNLGMTPHL